MKNRIYLIGTGMTPMVKQGGSYEELCKAAISEAMEDAGLNYDGDKAAIGGIWYGNCAQGMLTSQHSIRGQVILRRLGFECMPIVNVENACATGSTALNQAVIHVLAGESDLALAVGVEKMMPDLSRINEHPELAAALPYMGLSSFWNGSEQDRKNEYIERWRREKAEALGLPIEQVEVGSNDRSPFMDNYALKAVKHMKRYGYTQEQMAKVCAKTHHHSTMNPKAQYRRDFTWEEVMADKLITYPLTRPMCAPRGEGCAAAIVCSEKYLNSHKNVKDPIEVMASVLVSGRDRGEFDQDISGRATEKAFIRSGLKRKDIDVLEVHDATTFAEIFQVGQAGFCSMEQAADYCSSGATALGGELPTNVSGGLVSRGHPVGCTGLAMAYELATQLRGRAGERQVKGAKTGMQINGGGLIGVETAVSSTHIFRKVE